MNNNDINFLEMYLLFDGRKIILPYEGREVKVSRKYNDKIINSINGTQHHDIKGYNTEFNIAYKYIHADFIEEILDLLEQYIHNNSELYFCAKRRDGSLYSSEVLLSSPNAEVVTKKNMNDWFYSLSFKLFARFSNTNESGYVYELNKDRGMYE